MTEGIDRGVSGEKSSVLGTPVSERRLSIVYPPELVRVIALERNDLILGREVEGAACLPHRTVSRRHAEIAWDSCAGMHRVRDLDSHNGSWVDGRRIGGEPTSIIDGTVLRLGDALLVYEATRALVADTPWVSTVAIPGESFAARLLRSEVARAAVDLAPVFLVGDAGTGKEAIARELHRLSGRPGPLAAVNCAAIARDVAEAQLFGHLLHDTPAGDFGAHPGLFGAAQEGTLFLDEVGELPLDLQAKVLRAIDGREILPVGAAQPVKVDVRVVAATNRDLSADTRTGAFHPGLHARLARCEIRVPPLRARRRDLLAWVAHLHAEWVAQRGGTERHPLVLAPAAAEALLLAPWIDNLRGVERLVQLFGPDTTQPIGLAALPPWVLGHSSRSGLMDADTDEIRIVPGISTKKASPPPADELAEVLARYSGSVRATARHYGRDRRQVYRWLEAYGLKLKRDE